MTADDRCDLTDLLRDQCAHCTGRDGGQQLEQQHRTELLARRDTIEAKYPGRCTGCGEPFTPGEPIKRISGTLPDPTIPRWLASCCVT